MRYAMGIFLALLSTTTCVYSQHAQTDIASSTIKKQTLTLSFGAGVPQSHNGLTSFWNMGPSGSVRFLVNVSKPVSFGVGLDAALLNFSESSFRFEYPGVPLESKNILMTNVYLAMKCVVLPSMRFSPYCGVTLGATRVSEAVYKGMVDSVRINYYNIPARTKLTIGLALGSELYLTRWLSLDMEAKLNYVHNDPDLGMASFMRGGFRFTL